MIEKIVTGDGVKLLIKHVRRLGGMYRMARAIFD